MPGSSAASSTKCMSQQLVAVARALHDEARHLSSRLTQQRVASDDGSRSRRRSRCRWRGRRARGAAVEPLVSAGGSPWSFGAGSESFTGARAGDGEAFAGAEWRGEVSAGVRRLFSTRVGRRARPGQAPRVRPTSRWVTVGSRARPRGTPSPDYGGRSASRRRRSAGGREREHARRAARRRGRRATAPSTSAWTGLEAEAEGRAFAGARADVLVGHVDLRRLRRARHGGLRRGRRLGVGNAHRRGRAARASAPAPASTSSPAPGPVSDGEVNLFNDHVGLRRRRRAYRAGVGWRRARSTFGIERRRRRGRRRRRPRSRLRRQSRFRVLAERSGVRRGRRRRRFAGGTRDVADDLPLSAACSAEPALSPARAAAGRAGRRRSVRTRWRGRRGGGDGR